GQLNNGGTINMNGFGIINYDVTTPLANVLSQIQSGYASGSWNGIGINSTSAATARTTPHPMAVGYAEAASLGLTTFANQTVDSTAVLLRYTFDGDANLDGTVNSSD